MPESERAILRGLARVTAISRAEDLTRAIAEGEETVSEHYVAELLLNKFYHNALRIGNFRLGNAIAKQVPRWSLKKFADCGSILDVVNMDLLSCLWAKNAYLAELNLLGCRMGDAGAKAIADGLRQNSTLTSIDLRYNGIGDAGAAAIADGLRQNANLQSIYLGANEIGDAGAAAIAAIADGLRQNSIATT